MPGIEDKTVAQYVDALLAGGPTPPLRHDVRAHTDIKVIKQYRVICPACGELPDSPFLGMADAIKARRDHWNDHRDERI